MTIDTDRLRRALTNYFGTAMMRFPMAIAELSEVKNASPERLVEIAEEHGFDISEYEK